MHAVLWRRRPTELTFACQVVNALGNLLPLMGQRTMDTLTHPFSDLSFLLYIGEETTPMAMDACLRFLF